MMMALMRTQTRLPRNKEKPEDVESAILEIGMSKTRHQAILLVVTDGSATYSKTFFKRTVGKNTRKDSKSAQSAWRANITLKWANNLYVKRALFFDFSNSLRMYMA
ncbi:CIC11C00000000069 [Sungouiella intermedia]|uniref:CIC11C00000000069 n=1 Tax=Sungouiella intermedia TaxID=45354 RepID=A0A1L0D1Q6_9ASCO|nr:CIC11C00000000069 [[Candida] intermedia]